MPATSCACKTRNPFSALSFDCIHHSVKGSIAIHCVTGAVSFTATRQVPRKSVLRWLPIWPNSHILACMTQRTVFKQQARVLKALANESRLIIIDRLNRGECSVGELTDLIGY